MRSLRTRAVIGAVTIVGVALLIGSVSMVLLVRSSLTGNVREAAELRADDLATVLEAGGESAADLAVEDDEDALIQVIGPEGDVVASSPNVDGLPPVADLGGEQSTVLDHVSVGGSVMLSGAEFFAPISFDYTKIEHALDMSRVVFRQGASLR